MKQKIPPQWLVILAFSAIYILWGLTYLAIAFSLKGFPPFVMSTLRYCTAGAVLIAWCLFRGEVLPTASILKVCIISGIVMLVGGSSMVAWAEQYVSSGQAAIIIASEPFWFLLLDRKRRSAYFTNRLAIAGLFLGFIGIVLLFQSTGSNSNHLIHNNLWLIGGSVLLISAIVWVIGSLYATHTLRSSKSSTTMHTGMQLVAAGLFSSLIAFFTGEWMNFSISAVPVDAWIGLLYLTTMGSLVAYLAFTWLITVRPPALVSTHTYVNPVVAILGGWVIAKEVPSSAQVLALVFILTGVLLTSPSSRNSVKTASNRTN